MKLAIVGSGSKGNACLIYTPKTLIQIDMGLPLKRIDQALRHIKKKTTDIQALFITHEHGDHIGTLDLYHGLIPTYASVGTLPLETPNLHEFKAASSLQVGDLMVTSFPVSHDVVNPVGFLISHGAEKLAYVTDTGYLSEEVLNKIKDCDYYYFESNHDLKMLLHSSRPEVLKKRIHNDTGHLANVDSAIYMAELIGPRTKKIVLAHISEECNTPELALATYREILSRNLVSLDNIELIAAKQWEPTYLE